MKFDYQYRTRDNELKSGTLSSSSREGAFAALKAQGIHPSRVVLSPGLLNRLASFGKRGWAIVVLCALLVSVIVALIGVERQSARILREGDVDPEVLARLRKSGLDVEAVNELLLARRRINDEYRRKIESDVARGKLSRAAANELLSAAGLAPLPQPQRGK